MSAGALGLIALLLAPPGFEQAHLDALEAGRFVEASCADEACGGPPPRSYAMPDALTTRGLDATPRPPIEAPALDQLTVPVTLNGPVRDFLEFFQQRGRFIYARWYARMGRFAGLMGPILERHGVPRELLYVCMIESGFNPDAVSRAAAVGQWQFVRSTAGEYALRFDDWVDERRDPIRATEAAATHFADLYARFGSWPLVLAAYNAGVGSVARAIERANTNDFWRLAAAGALPGDAARYVPKAMAAMVIGHDPARFGFAEVVIEPPWSFAEVEVPGGRDLHDLARLAGVEVAALVELNPALRRGFTPPDGVGWPLRVPTEAASKLTAALDDAARAKPGVFVEHRVRFGERLRDIARAYGVSRRTLRRLNGLGQSEAVPGQVLVVPKAEKARSTAPSELLVVTAPELRFAVPGRERVYFPVRERMALDEVAAFFQVAPGHLAMWNGLDPVAPVQRGMVLQIYVPPQFDRASAVLVEPAMVTEVEAGSEAAANALAHAQAERAPTVQRVLHEVKRGENLWTIARKHGVTVAALRAENGLGPKDGLSVGQSLKVPRRQTPRPRGKAAKRRPKADARGRTQYTVRSGDSLWSIARRYGVEVGALRKRNGLDRKAALRPGQRLVIP